MTSLCGIAAADGSFVAVLGEGELADETEAGGGVVVG
jgi:hypothetical protein